MRSRGFAACVRLTTGVAIALLLSNPAHAQDISVNFGQGAGLTERVIQLIALLTVLSLAPSILVMMTSFTRIVVVLSLLRTALGTATAPPNAVIVSLALFLTAFVMGPAFQRAYDVGIKPMIANEITAEQAFERSSGPFKEFMLKNVREKDLKLFNDLSNGGKHAQGLLDSPRRHHRPRTIQAIHGRERCAIQEVRRTFPCPKWAV